jgi:hypothetical protein
VEQTTQPAKIPASTAPFFQEYDFSTLDPARHAALIIERILALGNRAEVKWLIETMGKKDICEWLVQSGRQRLPERRYHLWCQIFDAPWNSSTEKKLMNLDS